ncbi:unnamed protein product [Larinioides sclopetarius]|uniref:Uncharacterized protein n=1 Tax=Larinioides sclopetarius TaxID=280406 RepID=A0AAV1Z9L1_9ARAC
MSGFEVTDDSERPMMFKVSLSAEKIDQWLPPKCHVSMYLTSHSKSPQSSEWTLCNGFVRVFYVFIQNEAEFAGIALPGEVPFPGNPDPATQAQTTMVDLLDISYSRPNQWKMLG